MPYLPVELDALNKFAHVAAAGGVERPVVTDGMVFMWAYCFREDTDRVTRVHVRGFFGVDITDALLAFGFLETSEAAFRVKGAEEKLLAQKRARRAGGIASRGNLKRGTQRATSREGQPEPSREAAGEQPGSFPGSTPALTPSTQHPTPNTREATAAAVDAVRAVGALAAPAAVLAGAQPERRATPRHVPRAVEKPTGDPETWGADEFLRWTQWLVQENGLVPSGERPRDWSAWYSAALMTPGVRVRDLMAGFKAFGREKHWEAQGFPLRAFVSQWSDFVNKGRARAAG